MPVCPGRRSWNEAVFAGLALLLMANIGGCRRSVQALFEMELMVECPDGTDAGYLEIRALQIDVTVCAAPGDCNPNDASDLLVGSGLVAGIEAADLSPLDPYVVRLDYLGSVEENTWIRVWATALDVDMNGLASGTLDMLIDGAGLLRAAEPLILLPVSCGFLGMPDYDDDGYVGRDDCDNFNPGIFSSAYEVCDDGIDNDCDELVDWDDPECDFHADSDGDGLCAIGIPRLFPGDVPQWVQEQCPNGFLDCDDNDPSIGSRCACDEDGDGFCPYVFPCPHNERLGIDAICAPGNDCCDQPTDSGCPDGTIPPEQINPDADEVCDWEDNNCDGKIDRDAPDAVSCFGPNPDNGGACEDGVRCVANGGVANPACHSFGGKPVDSRVCGDPPVPYCVPPGGGTIPHLCMGTGDSVTLVGDFGQLSASTTCSYAVIPPTLPFDVMPSSGMLTGIPCGNIVLTVRLAMSVPPGIYSFFVYFEFNDGAGIMWDDVFRFNIMVADDPAQCTSTNYICTTG